MKVTVNATLTTKEMFNFLMYYNYRSIGGIVGVAISIGAFVLFIINIQNEDMTFAFKVALLAISLMYTVVQPLMLYKKAAVQVKQNDSVNKPLKYQFDENTLTISIGEESVTHNYDDILMIKSTKLSIFIYITRYRAFILPKKDIGAEYDSLKNLLKDNVRQARCVDIR